MTSIRAQLDTLKVGDNTQAAIMGVINRDPNTFFRGSYHRILKRAIASVGEMIEEGADIIDVGGASTAPGSPPVSLALETRRVVSTIKEIRRRWDIPLSVDTQRSKVAIKALRFGATTVNDVSGLKTDYSMAKTISEAGASCIVMACIHQPGDCTTMEQIHDALESSLKIASNAGIPEEKVIIDPGIGFGKPSECDFAILHNLRKFRALGHPILVGVSRKAFIGKLLGYPSPDQRLAGTLAAISFAVQEGAHIIRAHDIRDTKDCIRIIEAINKTQECKE